MKWRCPAVEELRPKSGSLSDIVMSIDSIGQDGSVMWTMS